MNTAVPVPGASPQSSNPVVIAGQTAGRPIYCAPGLASEVLKLEEADRQGNHWARVAIKELKALTTGHLGKKNVFVGESPHLRRNVVQGHTQNNPDIKHSITLFYAFLPGLKATIAQRPDGGYFVVGMELDERYSEAITQKQPGLYKVSKDSPQKEWQVEYKKSGHIEQEDYRAVAISETKHAKPIDAASTAADCIIYAMGKTNQRRVEAEGFDLHFTPGRQRLGSLVRYDPFTIESAHGSAVQLADTMLSAKNTTGVRWVSAYGGSVIFTQAMQVLAAQGLALEGHEAYLYRPKTSPGDAIRLAHQLKFELAEKVAHTGLDPVGAFSQRRVAGERLRNETDRYNKSAHNRAVLAGVGKSAAVISVVAGAGMAAGGAFPMVAAVTKVLAGSTSAISLGGAINSLAEHIYEPHIDKLKRLGKR